MNICPKCFVMMWNLKPQVFGDVVVARCACINLECERRNKLTTFTHRNSLHEEDITKELVEDGAILDPKTVKRIVEAFE